MDNKFNFNLIDFLILLCASFSVSFTFILNKYVRDKIEKKNEIPMAYISEALLSVILGMLVGLYATTISENIVIWILLTAIGTLLGKRTFPIIMKIFINLLGVIGIKIEMENVNIFSTTNKDSKKSLEEIDNKIKQLDELLVNVNDLYDEDDRKATIESINDMKKELMNEKIDIIKNSGK